MNTMTREELLDAVKKVDSRKECLHPQASDKDCDYVINAHTIQKEGSLRNISHKGQVQWPDFNVMHLLNEG